MNKKIIQMDISVGTGIFTALGRQDVRTDQIFREFIDNSTSSYFDHKDKLVEVNRDHKCIVEIKWDDEQIVITDNAFGMNQEEFNRALKINATSNFYSIESRSQYGLGLKYALASLGKWFSIESTAYDSIDNFSVEVDLEDLSIHQPNTLAVEVSEVDKEKHGTKIIIRNLTKKLNNTLGSKQKTKGKINKVDDLIKKLAVIYKHDIENQDLEIRVNNKIVKVTDPVFLQKESGGEYWTTFNGVFKHGDQNYEYSGWVGILNSASVSDAGFTLIQKGRAIQLNYRPESLFRKSNDFRYQRVIGEIVLESNSWIVTFTKDAIKWDDNGLQEAFIEDLNLNPDVRNIFKTALEYRKKDKKLNQKRVERMNLGEEFKNLTHSSNNLQEMSKSYAKDQQLINNRVDSGNTKDPIPPVLAPAKEESIPLPIRYCNIDYQFIIQIKNDADSECKFLRITIDENVENKYYLQINDTVPIFEKYLSKDSKELIIKLAICLALTALASEKKGVSLGDSQKFIEQLNSILNDVKTGA